MQHDERDERPGEPAPSGRPPDDDAWIERVVGIAGHLGFNKMRLRWKLIRWQEQRRRSARLREQRVAHITYAHKTCDECGAVHDRAEPVCTRCGAKLAAHRVQILERIGLMVPVPRSISTLLAVVFVVAYVRVWIAAGGGLAGPSGQLLVDFGGRWPPVISDEPWRLVTACLLHAGLWHLGFNLLAIASVGPRLEQLYGRMTTLALFIITGTLANFAELYVGPMVVGIGASGGVMGLIGATAACGHRRGTSSGRAVRDAMLRWVAYTFLFGYAIGADNWAHLFGLIAGAIFGWFVVPETWSGRPLVWLRMLVGGIGAIAVFGGLVIILTRTPSPPAARVADDGEQRETSAAPGMSLAEPSPQQMEATIHTQIKACIKLYSGDLDGAEALSGVSEAMLNQTGQGGVTPRVFLAFMCDGLQQMRTACGQHVQPGGPIDLCRLLDSLPAHERVAPEPQVSR